MQAGCSKKCIVGLRESEDIWASASGICVQWGESRDEVKLWCNGYSETAVVCGDWSQLGHPEQLNCAIDWPLLSGMKKTCGHCCYVTYLHQACSAQRWLDPSWIQMLDVCELQWCNRKKSLQGHQRDRQDNDTDYPKKTVSIFIERFHIASCCLLIRQNWLNPQMQYINRDKISEDSGGRRKRMGKQLVGFTIAEIKARIPA